MNISGVLVRAKPQKLVDVSDMLKDMDGVDVHGNNEQGHIVITVEQCNSGQLSDTLMAIHQVPGVLSASMIYHYFED